METRRIRIHTSFALFCLYFCLIPALCKYNLKTVYTFERNVERGSRSADISDTFLRHIRQKRSIDGPFDSESQSSDSACQTQQENFKEQIEKAKSGAQRLEATHVFLNESKFNLALAWAGENDDGTLMVLTTEAHFLESPESTLWRSTDHGRTWKDWTEKVEGKVFRKDDGLQRNPHNPRKVYLIGYEHFIYVTEDGGETWQRTDLTPDKESATTVDDQLEFHPEPQFENYVAIVTNDRSLYVTYDNFGSHPKKVQDKIHSVKWGTAESSTEMNLFMTVGDFLEPLTSFGVEMMDLQRYHSKTGKTTTILSRVVSFNVENKFIYASIYKDKHPKNAEDERLMMISTDGGDTWNEAQLPSLTRDRFFSVLDMSEGMIFMHVDNPGDSGHGILYTSSSNGLVYSESLKNHLFPNYNTANDFYKVESIRGVYLASQMNTDKSIHTVITYNRGGEWKKVPRPPATDCRNDEGKGCFLQIHNAYSIHRGINAQTPLSRKDAVGLVLVHAHIASNLQTTAPDVFLSTDGGYNFRKVLEGPHAYEIADSGGLLVAVPLHTDHPDTIKFSTDEGHCWHVYRFTQDVIKFTGLLTEPGGKSMTVSIWGYRKETKKWTVNVIDFNTVVKRKCKDSDYIPWTAHANIKQEDGREGCLLGQKETFKKIKPDSWCQNGYEKSMDVLRESCQCTEEDYECDFGFYHPVGSTKCVRQPEIKAEDIDVCKKGHFEQLQTIGYRLVPGDECKGGFQPTSDTTILSVICNPGDEKAQKHDSKPVSEDVKKSGSSKLVIAVVVILVLVLVAVVGAFFTYKMVLLRRHKVVYRYSMLNQEDAADRDNEFENALTSHDTLYKDSSDEEAEQENVSPKHNGSVPKPDKTTVTSYHDDSDDDMLG